MQLPRFSVLFDLCIYKDDPKLIKLQRKFNPISFNLFIRKDACIFFYYLFTILIKCHHDNYGSWKIVKNSAAMGSKKWRRGRKEECVKCIF